MQLLEKIINSQNRKTYTLDAIKRMNDMYMHVHFCRDSLVEPLARGAA